MTTLPPHSLVLGLVRPQIPQNVGNVARTCVVTGTPLHLAGPMPFALDDARMKRSGLDYWPRLKLTVHDSQADLLAAASQGRAWLFDSAGEISLFDARFADGDWLIFGSETHGLSRDTLDCHPGRTVHIPQVAGERCLNLASSAAVALYVSLVQIGTKARRHGGTEARSDRARGAAHRLTRLNLVPSCRRAFPSYHPPHARGIGPAPGRLL